MPLLYMTLHVCNVVYMFAQCAVNRVYLKYVSCCYSVVKSQLSRLLAASVTSRKPTRTEFHDLATLTSQCLGQMIYGELCCNSTGHYEDTTLHYSADSQDLNICQSCHVLLL